MNSCASVLAVGNKVVNKEGLMQFSGVRRSSTIIIIIIII